jgi:hypothetical protein
MNIIAKILTVSCLFAGVVLVQVDPAWAQPSWRLFFGPRVPPGRRVLPPPPPPRVIPRPPIYVDPIPEADTNPLPPPEDLSGVITSRIINPIENEVALKYAITTFFVDEDGLTQRRIRKYNLAPGQHQDLLGTRRRVISFDRGGDFGLQQYKILPGQYTFQKGDRGWELHRKDLVVVVEESP